jgi:hypothetical protein
LIDARWQVGVDIARSAGVRLAPCFRHDELRRPLVYTASDEDRFGGLVDLGNVIPEQLFYCSFATST